MYSWEDEKQSPRKHKKIMKDLQTEFQFERIEKMTQTNLTRAVKDVVLKNIYRQYYDLPNDQSFRKPDMVMRTIVETSETI